MTAFAVVAFVMIAAACALLVAPLLRPRRAAADGEREGEGEEPLALASALALIVAVPGVALAFYFTVSDGVPDPTRVAGAAAGSPETVASVEQMVAGLEQRLREEPDDPRGWQMLARSYVVMGRHAQAMEIYRTLVEANADDPGLLADYAEARILVDETELAGTAATLLERVLELAPRQPKGLWYGGIAAFERGDFALARDRWQALAADAPPEVQAALAERIAAASDRAGGQPAPTDPAPATAAGVDVRINIAPAFAGQLSPGAPLFVLARAHGGGPPVAVVRRSAGELPLTVRLDDDNAMVPGRTLSAQTSVEIVARVALGGTPTASPGDLFGTVDYNIGSADAVEIVIDQVQP